MSIELGWYLSSDGDGAHIGTKFADSPPGQETFARIAQNAEQWGFSTLLIPISQVSTHYSREAPTWDSIINATMLSAATQTIKLLIAVRVGTVDPVVFARMAASLDQLSGGRIICNLVSGGGGVAIEEQNFDGAKRVQRAEEYLKVLDGLWTQDTFSFEGSFYKFKDLTVYPKPVQELRIPLCLAANADAAREIAVRCAEYALFWVNSPEQATERVDEFEKLLGASEKRLKYVSRLQIVARETEEEACIAAQEVLSKVDPEVLAQRGKEISEFKNQGAEDPLERTKEEMIGPNLWAGMGRLRSGAAATSGPAIAILGSYEQCAKKIFEFGQAGIDLMILSGFPLHSECERIGRHIIPLVREMEREADLEG
ncbi:MAG: LLM class flavin-dependent oxidoreductase [Nitrospinaceae bacterium]|jgi:alkanesulfonate monooxygenase|nr:LLM class flavin-dependent oxidoreductase [Nitrospinaceae bacterium]MBT4430618.1 LLM class flavin-dependent oxidoreductase [Nitrospinaceae bacterium]